MKKIVFIAFLCMAARVVGQGSVHTFAERSVLAEGRFVKVRVSEGGLHKLTYSDLQAWGIDPSEARLFGYGGAMLSEDFSTPDPDDLPEVAVYDNGQALIFYAQGPTRLTYDTDAGMFVHHTNPYSDYGYYFVTSDLAGERKQVGLRDTLEASSEDVVEEYVAYALHEEELYSPAMAGRELYGELFNVGDEAQFAFSFPNLISGSPVKVKFDVINISKKTVNSSGTVTLNNRSSFTFTHRDASHVLELDGRYDVDVATPADTLLTFQAGDDEQTTFTIGFSNASQSTATGYLNFLEVNARCRLVMNGTPFAFHRAGDESAGTNRRYRLTGASDSVMVWDVTDPQQVEQLPVEVEAQGLLFVDEADRAKSYVAFDPEAIETIPDAELLEEVASQNLHAMEPADMLIITHPDFLQASLRLAQAHVDYNDSLRVAVVTSEQVYNEFSSGTPDATAYRRLCKMLYDRYRGTDDQLRYLLLMGKGSFDNRGRLSLSGDRMLLTFQAAYSLSSTLSYSTDDYFGLLDDSEGTGLGSTDRIDIGIGRLPVRTVTEADTVVAKIIRYLKGDDLGSWRNNLCFVGDNGDDATHMAQADGIADNAIKNNPAFRVTKLFVDAFQYDEQTGTFDEAKLYLQDLIETGLLALVYMGHATKTSLGDVLDKTNIRELTNPYFPLFVCGTCDFNRFDREYITGGEELLLLPDAGAIGVFSSCRTVYQNYNTTLITYFMDSLITWSADRSKRIGDVIRAAKNMSFGNANSIGANTLSYVYFGDPAVRLHFPNDYELQVTSLTANEQEGDTLKALSTITLQGIVADEDGEQLTSFRGKVEIELQDKEESCTTLGNDGETPLTYLAREVVWKGQTDVKDGAFSCTFLLPRDIKYNYGTGKFILYACDTTARAEAQGWYGDFIIGGQNGDYEYESEGPEAEIYLDNKQFVSGGQVGTTPLFLAEVRDPSGISTYSVTPGHGLTLCIDNESWYDLYDYYTPLEGDYRAGNITFAMPEQEEGKHELLFRVWDLLGNSTVKTLLYEVADSSSRKENISLLCWPNPVMTTANIWLGNIDASAIAQASFDLFDLSGRKLWSQGLQGGNNVQLQVEGSIMPSGVYILRAIVETHSGETQITTAKILVAGQ